MKKTILKLLSVICTLAMLTGVFAGCAFVPPDNGDEGGNEAKGAKSFVSLDINPEVSLTVDEENIVVSVYAENEDAKVLLYGEDAVEGMTLEEAVDKITTLALELGYLSEDNKVIDVIVSSDSEEIAASVKGKIGEKLAGVSEKVGIDIKMSQEGVYSLICELEAFKAQHPTDEEIQRLTPEKFKLAKSAEETGDIDLDEAVKMKNEELIDYVSGSFARIEKFATDSYNRAKSEAEKVYDKLVKMALEGVYNEYYMANIQTHPTTFYYGALYLMYASTARGYEAVADALELIENIESTEIDEESAKEIADALGAESVDVLKNTDGKITLDSIEDFTDRRIKNHPDSHGGKNEGHFDRNQFKEQVKGELGRLKGELSAAGRETVDTFKPMVEAAVTQGKLMVSALNSMMMLLPEEARSDFEAYVSDFDEIANELVSLAENKALTLENVEEAISALEEKAEEILEKINSDLTGEELEKIEERKAELEGELSRAKEEFNSSLKKAENDARARLEEIKAQRRDRFGRK